MLGNNTLPQTCTQFDDVENRAIFIDIFKQTFLNLKITDTAAWHRPNKVKCLLDFLHVTLYRYFVFSIATH